VALLVEIVVNRSVDGDELLQTSHQPKSRRRNGGYAVSEIAERLGISTKSLYTWKAQFSKPPHVRAEVLDQAAEIKRLKRELARVTEERRVATRYDRSPTVFLSAIMLAATVIFWL
jgi:predicted transcriptional regulator